MGKEKLFISLIKISFLLIILRSFQLQVIGYNHYYRMSVQNSLRTIPTGTPRGHIFDRNRRVLSRDAPSLELVFIPYDIASPESQAKILSGIIPMREDSIIRRFGVRHSNPYERVVLMRNLSEEQVSLIEENKLQLPGVFIQEGIRRDYLLGPGMAHVLGYTGEISSEQLARLKGESYRSGDIIGQDGVERLHDKYLRGVSGGIQVEVDAIGHHRKILGKKEAVPGNDIVLTIDQTIQEIAYEELGNRRGSVILMNPKNGQILAMVSRPSFAPDRIADFLTRQGHPFVNRAIKGQYPPGSVFKIITQIAALETGTVQEYDRIECTGQIEVGERLFHCMKRDGHGWLDINLALPFSCNIFFGVIGRKAGVPAMLQYANLFDFGMPTGVDLPGENKGYLPSRWETDPLNLSIGQGPILMTPIQMLSLIATIADGGNVWKPYVVQEIVSPGGDTIKRFSPEIKKAVYIKPETMDILKRGLRNAVIYGTGRYGRIEEFDIAGKTGTAQRGATELELADYAFFVSYAPAENPNLAMVVSLDSGSSVEASIIAGRIYRRIFFSDSYNGLN